MYEEKNNVIVETQLAGIDPDKVSISIENDVLCVKGESEKKSEVEDKNYYRKEIRRGSFYRSIPLPTHVDGDNASAVAEDGVLKISIPKATEVKPKTIKIQSKKTSYEKSKDTKKLKTIIEEYISIKENYNDIAITTSKSYKSHCLSLCWVLDNPLLPSY